MSKIGFVGAGKIGANAAFSSLHRLDLEEIVLVDLVENLAVGEAMDLNTASAGLGKTTKVRGGSDYRLLEGSDVVVVSAGLARKPGMTREDLLLKNSSILRDVTRKVFEVAPEAHLLVVTNPVDPLVYDSWRISKKPRSQVYGMGALHDSMRLWDILRDEIQAPKWNDSWILGNHGERMFPARSLSETGGAPVDWTKVTESVRTRAQNIIEKKGATYYAPAIAIVEMLRASLGQGPKALLPVVSVLEGEYGLEGVALGVPALLSSRGVEKIVEFPLSREDRSALEEAASSVRSQLATLPP